MEIGMVKIGWNNISGSLSTSRFVQTTWVLFMLFALSLALPGIAPYSQLLQEVCNSSDCVTGQLTPAEEQTGKAFGNSLAEYAYQTLIVYLSTLFLLLLLAAVFIWRKPTHWGAVAGAFWLVSLGTTDLITVTAKSIPALIFPARLIHIVQLFALVAFFCQIPDGRFRPGWLKWATLLLVPVSALVIFGFVDPAGRNMLAILIGSLIIGSLLYRYRILATTTQQEPVIWGLAGAALLGGAQLLGKPIKLLPLSTITMDMFPSNFFGFYPIFGMLMVVGGLTCLAVALLSDELFRVDVALNRAVVYSLLTLFVVGVYVLVVGYLSLIFQSTGSLWFSLVATGVVALLFQPIRERVQRFVNRMIYGERDDPYTVLTQLGQQLETAIASDEVVPTLLQTVREALKISYAAIALKQPGEEGFTTTAESGELAKIVLEIPLVYQNEPVGKLILGPRVGDGGFSQADRRLLNDLARQAGAAIQAVKQNTDLLRARQQLVTAREEERRRMRGDLHDGLGASLAAINLQAGEIQRQISSDPVGAAEQVEALRDEIRAAIADIRRLVYGLRPPALDELGLVEALRARADQTSRLSNRVSEGPQIPSLYLTKVTVEAPDAFPPLPAAVEAAAYRIAMEALTNSLQHAQAESCTIVLKPDNSGLTVEICDDGIGLPEKTAFGVGLISMRERCAELGGRLSIDSAPGQGTRVSAWFPLLGGQEEEEDAAG